MKSTIYSLVFMLLVFSCNSDDDAQQNTDLALSGTWSLVNIHGGFAGVNYDFDLGEITWDFNQDQSELTVTNTNTTTVIYDGLPTGTYDFELTESTDGSTSIVINTISYTITSLTSSELILDEGVASDGFLLTFSK